MNSLLNKHVSRTTLARNWVRRHSGNRARPEARFPERRRYTDVRTYILSGIFSSAVKFVRAENARAKSTLAKDLGGGVRAVKRTMRGRGVRRRRV